MMCCAVVFYCNYYDRLRAMFMMAVFVAKEMNLHILYDFNLFFIMMKTYKHRTLGWIYERLGDNYNPVVNQTHNWPMMPFSIIPELIENSQDREEVVEKDWIDEARSGIKCITTKETFREAIEKHAPKQKKFTIEEIQDFTKDYVFESQIMDYIVWFLDKHNLLSFEVRKSTDSQYQKEIKITDKNIDGCDHIFDDTVYQSRPPQKICIKCWKFFTY